MKEEYTTVALHSVENSSSVAALDAFLNDQLANAQSTNDLRLLWDLKVRVKRLLALADERHLGELAARILCDLQRASGDVAAAA